MTNLNRSIDTDAMQIAEFVNMIVEDKFLIPAFQRQFIWEPDDIIKFWDSIFRFYPVGSILCWESDYFLNVHRRLGGYILSNHKDIIKKFRKWVYIIDGQQRATSLLVSIFGGEWKIKGIHKFNYKVYFDATDASFFFVNDLEKRKLAVNPDFLIPLSDVINRTSSLYDRLSAESGFDSTIENNLRQLEHVFTDYKIPVILIRGFDNQAVCEIFERINQEGKDLESIDIMIARTFMNYSETREEDM